MARGGSRPPKPRPQAHALSNARSSAEGQKRGAAAKRKKEVAGGQWRCRSGDAEHGQPRQGLADGSEGANRQEGTADGRAAQHSKRAW